MSHDEIDLLNDDTNDHDLEFVICHIAQLWRRLLMIKTKHLGITAIERRALSCISCKAGLTQVELACLLELEPQNLTRVLDSLEKRVWIEKQLDASDRRIKRLFPTKQGSKVMVKIKRIIDDIKPENLEGISNPEVNKLTKNLLIMRKNIYAQLQSPNTDIKEK